MKVIPTALRDLLIIEPDVHRDDRGFFLESFNSSIRSAIGEVDFVQDNHSRSVQNVLRGLHYQIKRPQGKLVRAVTGRIFDVAVDIRKHSPTFGRHVSTELSADNQRILWVPPGFAHGFLTLSEGADLIYKVTAPYDAADERTILWSDPALKIDWLLQGVPIISAKDSSGTSLSEAEMA
jgi:dTDP-4-dehydrorhamnose 3,5-epimerase